MPRPLRVEFAGAIYHLMSRGNRGEPIFRDDLDRRCFVTTLTHTCEKTGWLIHAYCLMKNHFHVVAETPQPNLVVGMKWLLGTYTGRFNRRHQCYGHLFSGRYKSLIIDERSPGYLRTACDYVHLNPVRAGLVSIDQPLSTFLWSSYPLYLTPRRRPPCLRVDRLFGEHGIREDSTDGRREFVRRMEKRRSEGEAPEMLAALRRGWRLGAEDFVQRLSEKLGRRGQPHERARERGETDLERAETIVTGALRQVDWTEQDLRLQPKAHPHKIALAQRLRRETPMTRNWIARRIGMGSPSYVSHLLSKADRPETRAPDGEIVDCKN